MTVRKCESVCEREYDVKKMCGGESEKEYDSKKISERVSE